MTLPRLLPLLALAANAFGADIEKTSLGDLEITPVMHGTVLLQVQGKAWIVDPWSSADLSALPKADVILITDVHGDHMDPQAIAAVRKDSTVIVAPAEVAKTVSEAKTLANGESTTVAGVKIEAVRCTTSSAAPRRASCSTSRAEATATCSTSATRASTSPAIPRPCPRCAR